MKKFFTKENLYSFLLVNFGKLLVASAFCFFLDPNKLVIGGTGGVATILRLQFNFDFAISNFVINTALLIIGLLLLGKDFFIKTVYSTLVLPVYMKFFEYIYKILTPDGGLLVENPILAILFSSLILGYGIGIVLKQGGTTGGTEVPQKIFYKYLHIPFSVSLFMIDGAIVLISALLIKEPTQPNQIINLNMILYAVISMYLSGMVMDQIVFSGFNSRAVYIISDKNDEIKEKILKDFERGVTQIRVVGGYTNEEKSKLVCILSSSEFYKLKALIHNVDPKAFFYVVRANEVSGEGFTRK